MKQETLDKLKELHGKATPGPWEARTESLTYGHGDYGRVAAGPSAYCHVPSQIDADAELIAETRNALPDLLAEIERLNRVVDQAIKTGGLDRQYALNHTSEPTPDLAAELRARAEKEASETSETSEVQP